VGQGEVGRARQVGLGEVVGRGGSKPAAGAGPRAREVAFPFFSSFSFFLFPSINFIYYNELHIKQIHTKA
jgi:hypothetical protein